MTLTLDLGEMQIQSLRYISNSTVMYKCSQTPTWKYGLSLQKDPVSGDAKSPLLVWIGPDIRVSIIFRGPKVPTFSEITGSPPKSGCFSMERFFLAKRNYTGCGVKTQGYSNTCSPSSRRGPAVWVVWVVWVRPRTFFCEVGRMPCDHIMLLKLLPIL